MLIKSYRSQRWDDVRISIQGEMDGAVPEPFFHECRVDALRCLRFLYPMLCQCRSHYACETTGFP